MKNVILSVVLLTLTSCSWRHIPQEIKINSNYNTDYVYDFIEEPGIEPEPPVIAVDTGYSNGFLDEVRSYAVISGFGELPGAQYKELLSSTYFVDAENGSDITGMGSENLPWQTLAKVQAVMQPGDTFCLATGSYGIFREANKGSRNNWITIKAMPGAVPVFDHISIRNAVKENTYLRFDGITISSPSGTDTAVDALNVRYLSFRNCHISGQEKYMVSTGIKLDSTEHVQLYHSEITSLGRAILIMDSEAGTISNNYIHGLEGRTGIQYERGNRNFIIERNNVHDSNYDPTEPNAPTAPHASAISIRSGDVIIRSNIFHDIGSSSGIMMYNETDVPVYNNIFLINNLLYDIQNTLVFRIFSMGENIYFINNTVIGKLRDIERSVYKLYTALSTEEIADGYDGSGLHVYNNIFAGMATLPPNADISHNIFWSYYTIDAQFDFTSQVYSDPHSKVICGFSTTPAPLEYFKYGFFAETQHVETMFDPGHGNTLDFRLAAGSEAVNFGDPNLLVNESLGTLGPDGFLLNNGIKRDADHHGIGCYEYGTGM